MEKFKEYLRNKIKQLDIEVDSILDIDTKRKKIYRREICIISLELINEYEKCIKENEINERKSIK